MRPTGRTWDGSARGAPPPALHPPLLRRASSTRHLALRARVQVQLQAGKLVIGELPWLPGRRRTGDAPKAIRSDSPGRYAMTQQFAAPEPQLVAQEPLYVRLGDAFVIVSATLMSLAAGAWLIAHLELDLSYAIMAALATYCGLLLLHLSMRRAVLDDRSVADDARRADLA